MEITEMTLEVMGVTARFYGCMVITTTTSGWRIEVRDRQECVLFAASGDTLMGALTRLQEHMLGELPK